MLSGLAIQVSHKVFKTSHTLLKPLLSHQQDDDDGSNPFLPFMHGMMQSLLSAEILLPSMKELLEKYPKYLEENGEKIPQVDKERYIKQQELFQIICQIFHPERPVPLSYAIADIAGEIHPLNAVRSGRARTSSTSSRPS